MATKRAAMACTEESTLRSQLQLLPPGTANYVAALVDLASHLNDKVLSQLRAVWLALNESQFSEKLKAPLSSCFLFDTDTL